MSRQSAVSEQPLASGPQRAAVSCRRSRNRRWWMFVVLVLMGVWGGWPRPAQLQSDPTADFYALVNEARLSQDLAPLNRSTLLDQAAQRHANDMAARGRVDSTGSDGSNYRQRIRETGYRAWNEGLMVMEMLWSGSGSAQSALTWFRNDAKQWAPFVDSRYREIGIGYATDTQGVHYMAVDFGARPAVLPVFIDYGAATADSPQVAVRLTNEEAVPLGEGTWMGKAIEVRLSNTPDFGNAPWQPWEPLLPWTLADTKPGEYAVYVEFRDGAQRTAVSQDTIRLTEAGATGPTPAGPGAPVTATTTPTPTSTPTLPPASPSPSVPTPTVVPPTPTFQPSPTPSPAPSPTAGPPPTWTPLPTAQPVAARQVDWPLLVLLGLQGLVLLLGAAAFLRRR